MFTNISQGNYTAKIIRVGKVLPIPKADKIKSILVDLSTVVVGSDTQEGEIRIFFPEECQISHKLLSGMNEYRVHKNSDNLNADTSASGGFFESKRRVKPITLRGVRSFGYTVPAEAFAKVYGIKMSDIENAVGTYFDHVNGELVCNKYVKPVKEVKSGGGKGKPVARLNRTVEGQLNFHVNTANLRRTINELQYTDRIVISNKLHGTSWQASNVLAKRNLSWWERLVTKLGVEVVDRVYDTFALSRKVVRNKYAQDPKAAGNEGWYGKDIWTHATNEVKDRIPKGYSVFGELVGYIPDSDKMIQKDYDYGYLPGNYGIYVYRVTNTNPEGVVMDLTNEQVKRFCDKYQFNMAEEFFQGTVGQFLELHNLSSDEDEWRGNFISRIEELYNEKDCSLCAFHKVPEEGVVIRLDNAPGFKAFKVKSKRFLDKESKENDTEEVNIEDTI